MSDWGGIFTAAGLCSLVGVVYGWWRNVPTGRVHLKHDVELLKLVRELKLPEEHLKASIERRMPRLYGARSEAARLRWIRIGDLITGVVYGVFFVVFLFVALIYFRVNKSIFFTTTFFAVAFAAISTSGFVLYSRGRRAITANSQSSHTSPPANGPG